MQSANKAFRKDTLIYKSKDIPWKIMCRRLVDHVFPVFSFGSENWPWTMQPLERIMEWETKTMLRLFRLKKTKRRNMGRLLLCKDMKNGQEDMGTDGLHLSA